MNVAREIREKNEKKEREKEKKSNAIFLFFFSVKCRDKSYADCLCIFIVRKVKNSRKRYKKTGNDTMAQYKEAYVKYNSAFPFSACHPTGTPFKLMLYIRTTLSLEHNARARFLRTFFHPCDTLLKMKNKKTNDVNATTTKKHTLKSFETNTNVLKPSVSLPRLL